MAAVDLACESMGEGPPVLLLHGLFGSGRNWATLGRALAQQHRVLLPDARNHGGSPWAATMSYAEMADDLEALIVREGLERPIVIGHSMGGKAAMALALLQPQAVAGLAVIDIAPEAYADQFSSYVHAMRSLDLAAAGSRRELQQTLAASLGGGAPVDFLLQNLRRHDERFDWRINLMGIGRCMGELCGFPEDLRQSRYDGPTLFVSGGESGYVQPSSEAGIRALFPAAQLHTIADAGHWVHADQPDALLRRLQDWLASLG